MYGLRVLTMIKNILKYMLRVFVSVLFLCMTYLFFAALFSIIPVNRNPALNKDIEIFIRSNGVHLELILPLQTAGKDWTDEISLPPQIASSISHLSIGWGDKNFYYNTPQWSDLTFKTAFKALFLKSESAIHIDFFSRITPGKLCKSIFVNEEQYRLMVHYLESGFQRDFRQRIILIEDLHYSEFDGFYEATGSYNLFFTCNTWTNRCLKKAGLKASLWTPFDRGTLYHYRKE